MGGTEPGRRAANGYAGTGPWAEVPPRQSRPYATLVSAGPLDGRVALVTEGHRGLGLQSVRALAEQGMRVVLASRSAQDGRTAVGTLGDLSNRVSVRELDVMDATSLARLTYWLHQRLRRCDVLITHAPAEALSVRRDVIGALRLIQAIVPLMREHRYGRIINVFGGPATPADARGYGPSIEVMTRMLAGELAGDGILINAWCPATPPASPAAPPETPAWLATLPADGPTGRCYCGLAPMA